MKMKLLCLLLLALFGLSPLWVPAAHAGEYERGKSLYTQNCQLCHGAKGEGNGPGSASFTPKPRNFTKPDFWKNNPDKKIMNAVENGFHDMPPLGLSADQVKAIIDYMSHTFKK